MQEVHGDVTRGLGGFIVKGEGLLKVTGSHIHWKSDNTGMSETVLDRDATTGH